MTAAGLYVHIPFCRKKCAYCDFCSFTGSNDETHRKYLKKLQKEIDFGPDMPISTVYIGGGTPTLLSNRTLSRLMDAVQSAFVRTGSCPVECTVESN
ncbi:MAG: coproporphyrinogen III oxidase family protein, partial [Candidatus ainarchaeum sp.]|nr:coproporphyrinogen III oxidase family protein [Candidatus ainarchaeum sp.]